MGYMGRVAGCGMLGDGVSGGAGRRSETDLRGMVRRLRRHAVDTDMARRVAAFESLCGMVREKDNAACRGRVLPDRMCGDALRRGGAARQGSQPMRLSPRCASRQAVRPA